MDSTNKAKSLKIALIGAYPPPYGGITVHIQRLKEQLDKRGYEVKVYEIFKEGKSPQGNIARIKHVRRWLLKYLFTVKEDLIHLHAEAWQLRFMMGLMGLLGKKTVISIHSESLSDSLEQGSWFRRQLIGFALKRTSFIIAPNPKIKELVLSLGVKPEHTELIPPFIPPVVREEDIAEVPQKVWDFIKNHTPVVSANAFKIFFYLNQDLYGIDMCIDLCATLKDTHPQIGFVFYLPEIGDYEYFHKMKQRVAEKKIEDNFLFQTKPCPLYPIIMKSDVFVRPTNADGFGLSVAEAIYFKVPTVASNVCKRAEATVLFRSRDLNDFILKVKDVLDNYDKHKRLLEGVELENNIERIVKVYQRLCEKG